MKWFNSDFIKETDIKNEFRINIKKYNISFTMSPKVIFDSQLWHYSRAKKSLQIIKLGNEVQSSS